MSSKRSRAPRRKSSMKKLFSKNRKFGGDGDVSTMMTQQLSHDGKMVELQQKNSSGNADVLTWSTQELSYHGKMDELQQKIDSKASNVEGDYFALPPWNVMTNIQAALKGIVADKKNGTDDPTNTARMDIIMYLIKNGAKTDYIYDYLTKNPLPQEFLTVWINRLVVLKGQGHLVQQLYRIKSSAAKSQTPGAAVKDYIDEMNAIFVTEENKEPNAALNLLFSIAKNGTPENMNDMIVDNGQEINVVNESGRTPLMVAAENGNLGVVKVLFEKEEIRSNLAVSQPDNEGNTAFIIACNAQPVNEELVNYLAINLGYADLFLENKAHKRGYDILKEHKKGIDDKKADQNYHKKTSNQKDADAAQLISYVSLMETLKKIHEEEDKSAKEKIKANVEAKTQQYARKEAQAKAQAKAQAEQKATEEKKKTLKTALIKYVNDNFKETYLVFIDATMRTTDKTWKSLSKTCNKWWSKSDKCNNPQIITDLQSKKTALYTQIINYYNATSEWFSFEDVVKYVVLNGIKNLTEEKKTLIMNNIDNDIKKSDAELSAAFRSDKFTAYNPLAANLTEFANATNSATKAPVPPVVDNKKLLKDGLVKYINDKFKNKYLQFIDVEMREYDPKWQFISSCKGYAFSNCKIPSDFYDIKLDLYAQLVNYYNKTGEWIDFNTVVNVYVLDGIHPDDKNAINVAIKEDIEDSSKKLEAKKPSLFAGVVKSVVGSSRRSKKRSASKTRKQKK